jgi:hypothetical protein
MKRRDHLIDLFLQHRFFTNPLREKSKQPSAIAQGWNAYITNFNRDPGAWRATLARARAKRYDMGDQGKLMQAHDLCRRAAVPCVVPNDWECPQCGPGAQVFTLDDLQTSEIRRAAPAEALRLVREVETMPTNDFVRRPRRDLAHLPLGSPGAPRYPAQEGSPATERGTSVSGGDEHALVSMDEVSQPRRDDRQVDPRSIVDRPPNQVMAAAAAEKSTVVDRRRGDLIESRLQLMQAEIDELRAVVEAQKALMEAQRAEMEAQKRESRAEARRHVDLVDRQETFVKEYKRLLGVLLAQDIDVSGSRVRARKRQASDMDADAHDKT